MTHYISINKGKGKTSNEMEKKELTQALRDFMLNAPEAKHDCWLMSHGYSSSANEYHRGEGSFDLLDTILLDFDNELKTVGEDGKLHEEVLDPNLMKNFENEFKQYDFIIWESASSTNDWPRFRVLFLLDKTIEFVTTPEKFTKRAILSIFSKYKPDTNASWYYTPTRAKVKTMRHNKGIPFPSSKIDNCIASLKTEYQNRKMLESIQNERIRMIQLRNPQFGHNPEGWRNLPSVKKCLSGLCRGERDNSLNAACYAMNKNGYRGSIREFLDEVDVPRDIKHKFYSKYR